MTRLIARAKYLFDGERKFHVRGVSYGPFRPNSRGEEYPEPDRVAADFKLMSQLGVNVVRTYVAPPRWLMEEAARHGLRVMVGIPWAQHVAFLESNEMKLGIRAEVSKCVADLREFGDTILAYTIGNEIPSDIVRWHGPGAVERFLAELYDIGKQLDPEALFTYGNYPTTEYLALGFLDFISFNVYLHREEDFRRYLTHLMAASGELPLVLSETGMDTIREGEARQAELLLWQSRAVFELGLSGIVVFAFTDEWYRGGAEITDWAFGLTDRARVPKRACETVADVFRGELSPRLPVTPKVSVVVAAYNAGTTLDGCLRSLAQLDYPDYETIVVDDGSSDATAQVAEQAGVRVIHGEHRGLAVARNRGAQAASGEVVAFIDADARADRDWLYHLVEALIRRNAEAAGGPNFAPPADSELAGALARAPGLPREVRADGDELEQLCGCNMAIRKSALEATGGFDPSFTSAGDDVDLSWRMRDRGATLVDVPGAVVIHERRATVRAYLAQQRGYGAGEGLLYRKYPLRSSSRVGLYGGTGSWLSNLLGGPRVYYGAFGRGLFQTVYRGADVPWLAELPHTVEWVGISLILIVLGATSRIFGFLGFAGIAVSIITAWMGAVWADPQPTRKPGASASARATLAMLNLLGPLVRSFERSFKKLTLDPSAEQVRALPFRSRGTVEFGPGDGNGGAAIDAGRLLEHVRLTLVRLGLAVAVTDGFQSYDLQVIAPPAMRVSINAIREPDGRVALGWRSTAEPLRTLAWCGVLFALLFMVGMTWGAALITAAVIVGLAFVLTSRRLLRIPAMIQYAAVQASDALGMKILSGAEQAR